LLLRHLPAGVRQRHAARRAGARTHEFAPIVRRRVVLAHVRRHPGAQHDVAAQMVERVFAVEQLLEVEAMSRSGGESPIRSSIFNVTTSMDIFVTLRMFGIAID
jgi:hypothetical protein